MKKIAESFVMLLTLRYRVYFRSQAGCWYASYDDHGKRQRRALSVTSKPEAEDAVRKLDEHLRPKAAPVAEFRPVEWGELVGLFLTYKQGKGLAPRSLDRYRASLEAFGRYLKSLKPVLRADQITLAILEGYPAYRTGKKEKCAVKTTHNDILTIKGVFKWASKASRGLLRSNPACDWETPEPVTPKRPCYEPAEVKAMLEGVREWLKPVIRTLALTGMRIGELINLRWVDIDLNKKLIHVRIREDWRPKGKADRTIPMHPQVEALLRNQRVGKFVFSGPSGGRLKENYVLKMLRTDQRRLKLREGDLHSFRRYFATQMMRHGVDAETVRQWGGWKSLETMMRYLQDVKAEDGVEVMKQVADRLVS
jgi:integrase